VLKETFGDNALGLTQTYGWFKGFKRGWMSVDDDERSGLPSPGTTTENVAKVQEAILEDRRQMIHDIPCAAVFDLMKTTVTPHPPYSPDLAPCIFVLYIALTLTPGILIM
jgi:hypothetical protein